MSEPTKFAEFVMPELSKSRLDAQWALMRSGIENRPLERRRQSATVPALGVLVLAGALGVLWWPREPQALAGTQGEGTDPRFANEASVWEGSVVASDEAPVEMTLAEGTQIQVDPRSEVKLLHSSAHAVQVRLEHGSARFQVVKKRTRRFSVNLGKVEVVVTGTQFRVLRKAGPSGERVQVQVEEGSVEVHRGDGGIVALHAGENWSTLFAPQAPAAAPLVGEVATTPVVAEEDFDVGRANENAAHESADANAADRNATDRDASEDDASEVDDDDSATDDDQTSPRDSARTHRAHAARRRAMREAVADAGELLDHANLARRAGRLEDAAELYADLVGRYPRDRRASLAAFELGRLRMDSLRDVRGAVSALERALKLDGHGAFAEDALARLVLAEEALGDRTGCSRARGRYLSRYPEGVHAQHVAERCGGN